MRRCAAINGSTYMSGISLASLREEIRPVHVRIGTGVIRIQIYPSRLTNEVMDRYRDAQEDPRDYDEMAAAFTEFVTGWDLLENEGDEDPMPINGDTMRVLPLSILNHIWAELVEAVTPKSRKRNDR